MIFSKKIIFYILDYLDFDTLYSISYLSIVESNFWNQWLIKNFIITEEDFKGDKLIFRDIYNQKFCTICLRYVLTSSSFCCESCFKDIYNDFKNQCYIS